MKKIIFLVSTLPIIFLQQCQVANAQTIASDSKGNAVFVMPESNKFKMEFNSKANSPLGLSYGLPIIDSVFHYIISDSVRKNVIMTSHSLLLGLELTSSDKYANLIKSNGRNTGCTFSTGYQRTIDSFVDISLGTGFKYNVGVNFSYQHAPIDYMSLSSDTSIVKKNLITKTVSIPFNMFHKSQFFALAFNFSVSKAPKEGSLLSYSDYTSLVNVNGVRYAVTGDKSGKVGKIEMYTPCRFSVAVPLFPFAGLKFIPYWNTTFAKKIVPERKLGVVFSYSGQSKTKAKIAKGFGLGCDWTNVGRGYSSISVFLVGSFDLFSSDVELSKNSSLQRNGKLMK